MLLPWQETVILLELQQRTWRYIGLPVGWSCLLCIGTLTNHAACVPRVCSARDHSLSPPHPIYIFSGAGLLLNMWLLQEVSPYGSLVINHTAFATSNALVIVCGGGNCFSFGTHFDASVTIYSLPTSITTTNAQPESYISIETDTRVMDVGESESTSSIAIDTKVTSVVQLEAAGAIEEAGPESVCWSNTAPGEGISRQYGPP